MVDECFILKDWASRGFSGGVWEDRPERTWAGFVHAEDELMMVIQGEVELEIGGERLRLAPGQEVLIPAGTTHTIRILGELDVRWLYAYARQTHTRLRTPAY